MRQRRKRTGEIGLQIRADLEDDIGRADLRGVRGLQSIGMLGLRALDEQVGHPRARHHRRDQRMDGLDGREHLGRGMHGKRGQDDAEGRGQGAAHC